MNPCAFSHLRLTNCVIILNSAVFLAFSSTAMVHWDACLCARFRQIRFTLNIFVFNMQRIALCLGTTASITSTVFAQSFTACVGRINVTCEHDSFALLHFMCTLLGTRPTRGREEYNFIIARPVGSR